MEITEQDLERMIDRAQANRDAPVAPDAQARIELLRGWAQALHERRQYCQTPGHQSRPMVALCGFPKPGGRTCADGARLQSGTFPGDARSRLQPAADGCNLALMVHQQAVSAFPLTWPLAQRRTLATVRVDGQYVYKGTLGRYRDGLMETLRKMEARDIVISTNMPLRKDGQLAADAREPVSSNGEDPGVAVYFQRGGKPYALAMDRYRQLRCNVRALDLTLEALRTIERHGSAQLLEQAMAGFKQLPAHEALESWWHVLEIESTSSADDVWRAHYRLSQLLHPDRPGGSHELMARINAARDRALRDLTGG